MEMRYILLSSKHATFGLGSPGCHGLRSRVLVSTGMWPLGIEIGLSALRILFLTQGLIDLRLALDTEITGESAFLVLCSAGDLTQGFMNAMQVPYMQVPYCLS